MTFPCWVSDDLGRLSLQLSLPMAMLGHGVDERGCNPAGLTFKTDNKTLILCFLLTFMIGPAYAITFEAYSAQEPAPCA
jgi:hypothetical protein